MHISGLQNHILLWYFTSAIWGKLFCSLITLVTHHPCLLHYFCNSSAPSCHSCVIFLHLPFICIFSLLYLISFSIWLSLLCSFFYAYMILTLFSIICFCPWCQNIVLHSMQFSLLSHCPLILIFISLYLSFNVIQHLIFLNI